MDDSRGGEWIESGLTISSSENEQLILGRSSISVEVLNIGDLLFRDGFES